MIIALLISIAVVAAIQAWDASLSERGFAKGYTEGNPWIRAIFGLRPKTWQLYAYNTMWLVGFAMPGVFSKGNTGLFGVSLGLLTGLCARHIQAIYRWRKLGV